MDHTGTHATEVNNPQQPISADLHARVHENLLRQQKAQRKARKLAGDDPPRWAKWCIECPYCPSPQICSCYDSDDDDHDSDEPPVPCNFHYQGVDKRDITRYCEAWRQRDQQGQFQTVDGRSGPSVATEASVQASPLRPEPRKTGTAATKGHKEKPGGRLKR